MNIQKEKRRVFPLNLKGNPSWNKGNIGFRKGKRKPHSEETKRKISETKRLKNGTASS